MLHVLFLAIQQYLLAQLSADNLYIRMWNKQDGYLEKGLYQDITYPAVLIEFVDPIEWKQLGNGNQEVDDLHIKLHIIHDELDAATASSSGTMDQNLHIYQLAEQIYNAFQDWMPTSFTIAANDPLYGEFAGTYTIPVGVLTREREYQDPGHTDLYHFIQEYGTTWEDQTMNRPVGGSNAGNIGYDLEFPAAWNSSTAYIIGNAVIGGDNNIYACLVNNTNQAPPNATYWTLLGPVLSVQPPTIPILN
jgi:hypothetical protein